MLDLSHLQAVDFIKAYLQGAQLYRANLQGAQLFGANLQGTRLDHASLQGARLGRARLQGASLIYTELQGVDSTLALDGFANRIRQSIGKYTDLQGVVLAGGLSKEEIEYLIVQDLPDAAADDLRVKLVPHIGKPKSNELPAECGHVFTGSYTEEEAEKWIAEYEEAMPKQPE